MRQTLLSLSKQRVSDPFRGNKTMPREFPGRQWDDYYMRRRGFAWTSAGGRLVRLMRIGNWWSRWPNPSAGLRGQLQAEGRYYAPDSVVYPAEEGPPALPALPAAVFRFFAAANVLDCAAFRDDDLQYFIDQGYVRPCAFRGRRRPVRPMAVGLGEGYTRVYIQMTEEEYEGLVDLGVAGLESALLEPWDPKPRRDTRLLPVQVRGYLAPLLRSRGVAFIREAVAKHQALKAYL